MWTMLFLAACGGWTSPEPAPAPTPSPAPPADPGPERDRGERRKKGANLEFLEVPEDTDRELPLVISLHGLQGRAARMIDVVTECGVDARVVAPMAPDGRSWFSVHRKDSKNLVDVPEATAAIDELEKLLVELDRTRKHPGKVVVVGFSQGGMLTWALTARRPDLVAAALPMAGILPPAMRPEKLPAGLPPVRHYQPENDEWATPEQARALVELWKAAGGDATLTIIPDTGHEMREPMKTEFCKGLRELIPKG